MNLAKYNLIEKSEEGVWRRILDPIGETAMWVKVAGRDSKIVKQAARKYAKTSEKRKVSFEETEDNMLDILALSILDWAPVDEESKSAERSDTNLLEFGDEKLSPTMENKVKIMQAVPFVAEQVSEFIQDRAAFFT